MELAQVHSMEPMTAEGIRSALSSVIPAALLDPRGSLDVRLRGPWRPADEWPGGIERLCWTATFSSPNGRLLREEALPTLARLGLARPDYPAHPADVLGLRLGAALVVLWSDARQLAACTVWRDRRLAWSVLLEGAHGGREPDEPEGPTVDEGPGHYSADTGLLADAPPTSRMIRCDGHHVTVEAPVAWVPEGDRTGVLLAALGQLWREPLALDVSAQLTLPDTLEALTVEAPLVPLVRAGKWVAAELEASRRVPVS